MPDFEDYCRCPGCGTCGAHHNVKRLRAENEALRQDAERYCYQFKTGSWDYHHDWIGASKNEVDAAIDAALVDAAREL
jgi:hypothetical protein